MSGSPGHQKSRRHSRGYRRLGRQPSLDVPDEGEEQRVEGDQLGNKAKKVEKGASKKGGGKNARAHAHPHPLQKVLDAPRMDKAMAKPEFMRYLAYVREGGRWDGDSDRPVIFFD